MRSRDAHHLHVDYRVYDCPLLSHMVGFVGGESIQK